MTKNEDYIEETTRHITQVQWFENLLAAAMHKQVMEHDKSKLEEPEKELFMTVTPRLKGTTYGSPEYKETLAEIKPAIDHHNEVNRHHPEHHENGILDMDLVDIVEMLCDWKAASMRHDDGDIMKSLDICQKRFNMSDELTAILKNTVLRMGWDTGDKNGAKHSVD